MTRTLRATRVVAAGNELGEGIVWSPGRERLYWTDIQRATLWWHDPATGSTNHRDLPERLACFALCLDNDWLLAGFASRLAFLHLPSGHVETVCDMEPGLPTRVNDGACDREGRFVFGTLHEPPDGRPRRPVGSFYRLDADLSLHRLDLETVAVSNSLAFSPDGRTMYFCDTSCGIIRCCNYGVDGQVRHVRDWIDLRSTGGGPDGSTVDSDGRLWNALWGRSRAVRYGADGQPDCVVEVPASQPTRVALGGANLDRLYITSAREGLHAVNRSEDGADGDLFVAEVDGPGLPEPCFAGSPESIRCLSE